MAALQDFYRALDEIAPFSLAEKWDNVGVMVGAADDEIRSVLVALDATPTVVEEAARKGANLIVTHHPLIFNKLAAVPADSPVYRLIRAGIGVISAHTNLDIASGGVNDVLAARLQLGEIRPLSATAETPFYKVGVTVPPENADAVYEAMAQAGAGTLGNYTQCAYRVSGTGRFRPVQGANPHIGAVGALETLAEDRIEMLVAPGKLAAVLAALKSAHPYEEPAFDIYHNYACTETASMGRIGDLDTPLAPKVFAAYVKERLGLAALRYVPGGQPVKTVAVCGGSGPELLGTAQKRGAQAFITGEVKHHLWLDAGRIGMTMLEGGHHATEAVILQPLCDKLRERFPGTDIAVAESDGDGVKYM